MATKQLSFKSLTLQKRGLSVTPSLREQVEVKLKRFYSVYDPKQLELDLQSQVDYALAAGVDSLDANLIATYGDTLEGTANSFRNASYNNLTGQGRTPDKIRRRIELFFAKYEPEKLSRSIDTAAVVEWTLYNGYAALNNRLNHTYGANLDDVRQSDVRVLLEAFYEIHEPGKSREELEIITEWMWANGAEILDAKMREKYGSGLASARAKLQHDFFSSLLLKFYEVHEPRKLANKGAIHRVIQWTIANGIEELNRKLSAKYNGNDLTAYIKEAEEERAPILLSFTLRRKGKGDNTSIVFEADDENENGNVEQIGGLNVELDSSMFETEMEELGILTPRRKADEVDVRNQEKQKETQSVHEPSESAKKPDPSGEQNSLQERKEPEGYPRTRLLHFLEIFYSKHDPERLMDEGLTAIYDWAIDHGVEKLNSRMREKYDEDLNDIESSFDELYSRVVRFYLHHDPDRVSGLEVLVPPAMQEAPLLDLEIVEAPQLNDKRASGMRFVKATVESLVKWAVVNGQDALNDRLMAKYDDDLIGTGLRAKLRKYFLDVDSSKSEEWVTDLAVWVAEIGIWHLESYLMKTYGKGLSDPLEEKHLSVASNPVRPYPQSTLSSSRIASLTQSEVVQNPEYMQLLGRQIEVFLLTYDPASLADNSVVANHMNWILNHGLEAFNERMMRKYGHNLKTVASRRILTMNRSPSFGPARQAQLSMELPEEAFGHPRRNRKHKGSGGDGKESVHGSSDDPSDRKLEKKTSIVLLKLRQSRNSLRDLIAGRSQSFTSPKRVFLWRGQKGKEPEYPAAKLVIRY